MSETVVASAPEKSADEIADVQGSPDNRQIPIDKVGIKGIRHPVRVKDRSGREQTHPWRISICTLICPITSKALTCRGSWRCSMTMSTSSRSNRSDTCSSEMTEVLDAQSGHIEMTFPYFGRKGRSGHRGQESFGLRGNLHGPP